MEERSDAAAPIEFQPDAPLLHLPWELLVRICQGMDAWDLFDLGHTCRRLRQVARHRDAWKRTTYPGYLDSSMLPRFFSLNDPDVMALPLLRVAPALRCLRLSCNCWPPVDFLQCTNQVRVITLTWGSTRFEIYDPPVDPRELTRILQHYKGHLREVWMDRMLYENKILLKEIDSLGIKELYIARNLCRVYPGSTKTITGLKFDADEIDGDALAEVLLGCRATLVAFRVYAAWVHENPWAYGGQDSAVCQALRQCTNLEVAKITTWGDVSMLSAFPKLRRLTLCDFQCGAAALKFFRSAPVMRGLEALSLRLGYFAHRGVLQAVAEGCSNLRLLRLIPDRGVEWRGFVTTVDLPRDLHCVLGRLVDLDTLEIYSARLPSSVLAGLAGGALPELRTLLLHDCGLTPKARAALDSLRALRPDLAVVEERPGRAVHEKDDYWVSLTERCPEDACQADSDCEDEDPIPGDYHYDSDEDRPHNEMELLRNSLDPSDTEYDDGDDCGSSSSSA